MFYTIKQASEMLGVSAHTLRYYEKVGLFAPILRVENGNRNYSLKDLQWIHLVVCLRETGMGLEDVKKYIAYMKEGVGTVSKRYEMILTQKKSALAMIENIKNSMLVLEDKLAFYEKVMDGGEVEEAWDSTFTLLKDSLKKR